MRILHLKFLVWNLRNMNDSLVDVDPEIIETAIKIISYNSIFHHLLRYPYLINRHLRRGGLAIKFNRYGLILMFELERWSGSEWLNGLLRNRLIFGFVIQIIFLLFLNWVLIWFFSDVSRVKNMFELFFTKLLIFMFLKWVLNDLLLERIWR